jgi:hypothetical protein
MIRLYNRDEPRPSDASATIPEPSTVIASTQRPGAEESVTAGWDRTSDPCL